MRSAKMQLRLSPLNGGAYTQLRLWGPLPTDPQPRQWRSLLAMLSHANGYPVHAVLSVADPGFCEVWTHALCDVPERHLELRFRRPLRARR
jgi:hypothetical protein